MFEKVGCWIPVEIMTNTNRMVAEIDYADQPQLELRMQTPRTGSAPQKANEVLVSANILKDLNIEEKIGSEIPVELKVRQSDQVYHFDMVVSGIYDTPNEKSESVIVSKAFLEENAEMMSDIAQGRVGCGIYTSDVVMRDNYMVKDRISELVRNIGGNPDDVNAANAVRVAPNPIVSNESGLMMWLVAGVFGILFMFCGYLLIYNVFEIAVTNDIRQDAKYTCYQPHDRAAAVVGKESVGGYTDIILSTSIVWITANAADKLRDTLLYHGAIPHHHISIINATALTPLGNFAHHLRIFFHEGFGNND
jgi:putative ABC transport system permease protein